MLTVNNATSTAGGTRTYDFQVADSQTALGAGASLLASSTGVAEGAGGQTSYQLNATLASSKRYFWRARAVQGATDGPWSSVFRFQTDAAPNAPPIIQSLFMNTDRAEVNGQIQLTAVVVDQEADPASFVYEWASAGGAFTGSGASVVWRAPGSASPAVQELKLTVIERYTVTDADGRSQSRENRATAMVTAYLNDSPAELSALALTFLDDFVHSERSPEYCVRNFSDNCRGKADELGDIQRNRAAYIIDPTRSSFRILSISYNTPGNTPGQATFATVLAPCAFASTEKATGIFGVATGTCRLTNVYEGRQWRLCESNFLPPLNSVFDAFSRRFAF
ncbi:MAG: hypothetical protein A3H97_16775 [Acidobacteria bacterium RIFCSPLOWO2_02_FULL_65_29]|nr:MAG: hypothetical protein A3H97_16775 [Acidobacteria bacterium RIFCSPLOWO2_02_FULL_65_29]